MTLTAMTYIYSCNNLIPLVTSQEPKGRGDPGNHTIISGLLQHCVAHNDNGIRLPCCPSQ